MIKKILIPVDGSPHAAAAVDFASDIAKTSGASVTLLHVIGVTAGAHIPPEMRESAEAENVRVTTAGLLRSVATEILAEAEGRARDHGVEQVEAVIEVGDPAERIVACAKDQGADLIAMGRRGLGDAAGLLLGSVSHKVVYLAECPCLTVK
jgi:nucleotide-binding universal stress UspA family protein